jgi:hypothetical protein
VAKVWVSVILDTSDAFAHVRHLSCAPAVGAPIYKVHSKVDALEMVCRRQRRNVQFKDLLFALRDCRDR